MEAVVPAASVLVGDRHDHGFKPSDAALVVAGQTSSESRSNLIETSASAKDNLVQTLETKFQLERSAKENELAVERSGRASDSKLHAMHIELLTAVRNEAVTTRQFMQDQATARAVAELADAKAAKSSSDLLAAIKVVLGK